MWLSSYQIAIQRLSTKPTSCWFDGKSHPLRRLGERLWLRKRLHQTNHSGQIIATSHDQRLLPRKLRKGNLFISGESRWVKYFNLASESLEMLKFNSQTRKKDKGFSPKNLLPRRKRKSFSKTKIFPPPTPSTKKNTRCVCVWSFPPKNSYSKLRCWCFIEAQGGVSTKAMDVHQWHPILSFSCWRSCTWHGQRGGQWGTGMAGWARVGRVLHSFPTVVRENRSGEIMSGFSTLLMHAMVSDTDAYIKSHLYFAIL